ncbi:MAG: hypothetical protein JJ974_01150 [Phycisphaerales bacterium]|nr:hypothetical protein [Phycisphaerales bacterium]
MPFSLISATVLRIRPIGVTSDYCPVCRQERRFKLSQAEHRRYFLCMDRGRHGHPHHELTCTTCGCRVERPTEERPIDILPDPKSSDSYEPPTLPIVSKRIEDCSTMEAARRDDKLKAGQREEMIRHSLYCFARLYDEETFERLTPLARLLILIAVLIIGASGYYAWTQTGSPAAPIIAAIAIVLIFLSLMFWAFKHSPRKRVRTWLAMALLPLDPSREEIRKARAELQGSRLKAGFQIRTPKLLAKIKKLKAKHAKS